MLDKKMRWITVCFLTLLFACSNKTNYLEGTNFKFVQQKATVVYVEDGNSLFLRFNDGIEYKTNLVGVDAPFQEGVIDKCFFQESKDYFRSLVLHKEVTVEWDSGDKISGGMKKLLVYISLDNQDINSKIITGGYGWVPGKFPADRKKKYLKLQEEAKKNKRGLWGACEELPE